jgi:hypothetical protein
MSVYDNYKKTMQAEGRDMTEMVDYDKSQQYTLTNDTIREVYEENREICERKGLTIEQTLDAFVLALVDKGMPQDEAEEVCEIYDRTDGEYFSEDGDRWGDDDDEDDPDMPPDEDDKDEDYDDEDDEDDDEIIEV